MIISGKQSFTAEGKIGVGLFLVSPIASAFAGSLLYNAATNFRSDDELGPALLLFVSGMSFLIGIVLMLIGRSYDFTATQPQQTQETKGLWSQ